jgi:DNA-binding transcriptional LysR family regulator
MHVETLKVFCDLAELRSFSKTADRHLLSQSAISQQLAQLELSNSCQLIDRKKRPIELTQQGHIFYKAAKEIYDRYEQLKSDLSALSGNSAGRVNVGAIFSIGMHSLSGYVKKFMVRFPDINVHIEYLDAGKIYEQVLNGDIDIGVVAIPKRDKRLEVYDFENEELVLVCSPKHRLSGLLDIEIDEIQFDRFIAFEQGVPSRIWIDNLLEQHNISLSPVMEFDNIETIKRAVEINSGVSILPKTAIVQELSAGTLKCVRITEENFYRPTGIIIRRNRVLSQTCKYLIELLKQNEG